VNGNVTVGNKPVEFGSISFRGKVSEKTSEAAQIELPVRQGKFAAPEGLGTTAGTNQIALIVYASDPEADAESGKETKVVGTYSGPVEVSPDSPLAITLEAGDLQRPSRG
jgi:hypothetical protein